MANRLYFGLNTERNIADLENKQEGLKSLNLDIEDLNVIRGVRSEGLTKTDFKRISNLDVDAKKELSSIFTDSIFSIDTINTSKNFIESYRSNVEVNSKLIANSFKYKFIDFSNSNNFINFGDISTSRTSAWSSFGENITSTSPIFYGGQLEVTEDNQTSTIDCNSLELLSPPIELQYSAEVPTHLVTLKVGGVDKQFYAMRGIPLTFVGFFRSTDLGFKILDAGISGAKPSIVIEDIDTEQKTEYLNQNTDAFINLTYINTEAKERRVKFYYLPDYIEELNLSNLSMVFYPQIKLEGLKVLRLDNNNFPRIPNFFQLTPNLEELSLNNIQFDTSNQSANEQLGSANLPNTIKRLEISRTFFNNEDIDLTHLTNLEEFIFDAQFSGETELRMTSNTSPEVNSNVIKVYDIRNHRFKSLSDSVTTSPTLEVVDFLDNNIDQGDISFDSDEIRVVRAGGPNNNHNVITFQGKSKLEIYEDRNRRTINGNKELNFSGCTNLRSISLWRNDKVIGNCDIIFRGLSNLRNFYGYRTNVYGKFSNNAFVGATQINDFRVGSDSLGLDGPDGNPISERTFDEISLKGLENLGIFIVYFARNIRGPFPDLSGNENLRYFRMDRTTIGSNLDSGETNEMPNFFANSRLRNLIIRANYNLTGTIPFFDLPSLRVLLINNNNFSGNVPDIRAPNLRHYRVHRNNLTGDIPDFSKNTRLRTIYLFNNNFSGYVDGSFSFCTLLRRLLIQNNNLDTSAIENIIENLMENYSNRPRSNVNILLRGNNYSTFNQKTLDNIAFLRSNGWSINV